MRHAGHEPAPGGSRAGRGSRSPWGHADGPGRMAPRQGPRRARQPHAGAAASPSARIEPGREHLAVLCATTGCRAACSPPTPTSSTTAATRGTASSTSLGSSCPSASGTGPMHDDQRGLVSVWPSTRDSLPRSGSLRDALRPGQLNAVHSSVRERDMAGSRCTRTFARSARQSVNNTVSIQDTRPRHGRSPATTSNRCTEAGAASALLLFSRPCAGPHPHPRGRNRADRERDRSRPCNGSSGPA